MLVGKLLRTLWNARNKLVIEHNIPLWFIEAIYKLCGFLQLWKPLSKHQDRLSIDKMITALRASASRLAPPLQPQLSLPPPEPDWLLFYLRDLLCCAPARPWNLLYFFLLLDPFDGTLLPYSVLWWSLHYNIRREETLFRQLRTNGFLKWHTWSTYLFEPPASLAAVQSPLS